MKLISLYITEKQEEWIDILVNLGHYPNRSEAIRNFIDIGIKIQMNLVLIKPLKEEKLK